MMYFEAALKALGAAGLLTKVLIALGAAASLAAVYAAWHHQIYQSGVNDTIAKIAKADARMIERATKARSALLDCEARKMEWDMSTGRCK
jgi:hypothetical protein